MTYAWYDIAGTVVNAILAALYVALIVAATIAYRGNYHPKTKMIITLLKLTIVGSIFRILYFGIPNNVFRTTEIPQDAQRFTFDWWLSILHNVLFMVANVVFYGIYGIILFFWAQAYSTLKRRRVQPQRFWKMYWTILGIYGIAQIGLISLMVLSNLYTFLVAHAVIVCILSLLASGLFIFFYRRLDSTLSKMLHAHQRLDTSQNEMTARSAAEQQRA